MVGKPHLQSHVTFLLHGHVINGKNLHLHFHNINTNGHQTWQSGNLWSENPHTKSRYLLFTWSRGKCKNYVCTFAISMATKLGRVVNWDGGAPPSNSCDFLITLSRDKWKKTYIWTSTIHMATKRGRMVTYAQKFHDLLITWSHDKYKALYLHFCSTYDQSERPQLQSHGSIWLYSHVTNWKKKYLYFCNIYGHQTLQTMWPFD